MLSAYEKEPQRRYERSEKATREAKQALLTYLLLRGQNSLDIAQGVAKSIQPRLLMLPCPDNVGGKTGDNNLDGTQDPTCGAINRSANNRVNNILNSGSRFGRLPWRTHTVVKNAVYDGLGQDLRDGYGNRLWYALTRNMAPTKNANNLPLNFHRLATTGKHWLSVVNHRGEPIDKMVAVILAPGKAKNQPRKNESALFTATFHYPKDVTKPESALNPEKFFESFSVTVYSNTVYSNYNKDGVFVRAPLSDNFNDVLSYVSLSEMMYTKGFFYRAYVKLAGITDVHNTPAIDRPLAKIQTALTAYRTMFGFYPTPAAQTVTANLNSRQRTCAVYQTGKTTRTPLLPSGTTLLAVANTKFTATTSFSATTTLTLTSPVSATITLTLTSPVSATITLTLISPVSATITLTLTSSVSVTTTLTLTSPVSATITLTLTSPVSATTTLTLASPVSAMTIFSLTSPAAFLLADKTTLSLPAMTLATYSRISLSAGFFGTPSPPPLELLAGEKIVLLAAARVSIPASTPLAPDGQLFGWLPEHNATPRRANYRDGDKFTLSADTRAGFFSDVLLTAAGITLTVSAADTFTLSAGTALQMRQDFEKLDRFSGVTVVSAGAAPVIVSNVLPTQFTYDKRQFVVRLLTDVKKGSRTVYAPAVLFPWRKQVTNADSRDNLHPYPPCFDSRNFYNRTFRTFIEDQPMFYAVSESCHYATAGKACGQSSGLIVSIGMGAKVALPRPTLLTHSFFVTTISVHNGVSRANTALTTLKTNTEVSLLAGGKTVAFLRFPAGYVFTAGVSVIAPKGALITGSENTQLENVEALIIYSPTPLLRVSCTKNMTPYPLKLTLASQLTEEEDITPLCYWLDDEENADGDNMYAIHPQPTQYDPALRNDYFVLFGGELRTGL